MNKRLLTMARIYKPHVWNVVGSGMEGFEERAAKADPR